MILYSCKTCKKVDQFENRNIPNKYDLIERRQSVKMTNVYLYI